MYERLTDLRDDWESAGFGERVVICFVFGFVGAIALLAAAGLFFVMKHFLSGISFALGISVGVLLARIAGVVAGVGLLGFVIVRFLVWFDYKKTVE